MSSKLSPASSARARESVLVVGLIALGVGLPLAISAIAGTLEIPRNDDWSYRRMSTDMARTGDLVLDGMSSTLIVGQIVITQPLLWLSGLDPWAFTVAGILFAIGGMLGAYVLARQLLGPLEAALAAGLLAIFPGYLAYATSFMSDVPAMAAQFACLAMGAFAVRERRTSSGWLIAALAAGVLAFSIREFAVAAVASVGLVGIAMEPRRFRNLAIVAGAIVLCGAIAMWRGSLPGQVPAVGGGFGSLPSLPQAFASVAFVIAPAALVGAYKWRGQVRRFDLVIGFEVGIVLAIAWIVRSSIRGEIESVILTNLTSRYGVPEVSYVIGGRPELFGDVAWVVINVAALIATVVVLTIGVGVLGSLIRTHTRGIRSLWTLRDGRLVVVVVFVLAVTGGLVLFSVSRPIIDRYLWVLVTPMATLLLRGPAYHISEAVERDHEPFRIASTPSAIGISVVLAATSAVYMLNSHAFDAGRWAAGEALVRAGYSRDEIDAGYEWVGFHATTPGDPTDRSSPLTFYGNWFPARVPCAIVSGEPFERAGWELIGTSEYALNLFAGPVHTLHLYASTSPECPRPTTI